MVLREKGGEILPARSKQRCRSNSRKRNSIELLSPEDCSPETLLKDGAGASSLHLFPTTHSSKASNVQRPIPMGVKTVIAPRIPQDIVDEILLHLAIDLRSLRACALASKSWVPLCRRHLFHTVFLSWGMDRWLDAFPVPEESPAHHVRALWISIRGTNWFPDEFFEHIPRFTNVRSLSLSGAGNCLGPRLPSLWRLPESVTSLTIDIRGVSLVGIWAIMAWLPNLDDLSLWGPFIPADRRELLGVGTLPRGRFCGKLGLRGDHCANEDVLNMLLEIPTGLRFTKVEIRFVRQRLPSVVRFVEACCKTIVKLSLMDSYSGKSHPPSSSG